MDQNQNRNQDPNKKSPQNKQSLLVLLICIIVMLLCMNMMTNIGKKDTSKIDYSEFITMLDKGEVESVVLKSDTLTVTLKHGTGMAAQLTVGDGVNDFGFLDDPGVCHEKS